MPEFAIHHEPHGIKLQDVPDSDSEDIQHQMRFLQHYKECDLIDYKTLDLLLDPDSIISTVTLLNTNPSARCDPVGLFVLYNAHMIHGNSPEEQAVPLLVETTLASSHAKVMNHIFGALECAIKTHIRLFELRTISCATLFEDFSGCVQTLLDLHEDMRRMLQLAGSEAGIMEAMIQEVNPLLLRNLLQELSLLQSQKHSFASDIFDRDDTGSTFIDTHHRFPRHRSNPRYRGLSLDQTLNRTFSDAMWAKTLNYLRLFNEKMSLILSRFPNESAATQQSPSQLPTQEPSSIPLEDVYHIFPSFRALVNLHCQGFLHLPRYEAFSELTYWSGWSNRPWAKSRRQKAAEIIPWIAVVRPVPILVPCSAPLPNLSVWRPCGPKEQLEIASISQRMRKAWEVISRSRRTVDGANPIGEMSIEQVCGMQATQITSGRSTTKPSRSLGGDWSF